MSVPPATRQAWVAVALCASGVAMFSVMDVFMKNLSLEMGAYSAVLWRSVAGSIIGGGVMALSPVRLPSASAMRLHILRALLIGPMVWLFFWSFTRLPLAEAIALSFIAPIIALGLTPLMLKERVGRHAIIAAMIGLAGVLVIIGGRLSADYQPGALLGAGAVLLSAVLYAVNLMLQRQQAQISGASEVAFFQNFFVLLMFLPLAPWFLDRQAVVDWWQVIAAGGLTVASLTAFSAAYARARASMLIPLEYSAFLWACLFGWWIFGEALTVPVLAGAVLIVLACFIAAREKPQLVAHVEAEVA